MFAILVPVSLFPLITVLLWAENKAKKLGLLEAALQRERDGTDDPATAPLGERMKTMAQQLDLVGLILLGGAVALILLPLTLSQTVREGWKNGAPSLSLSTYE